MSSRYFFLGYVPKKPKSLGLGLGFQFVGYMDFGYFSNLLQITKEF